MAEPLRVEILRAGEEHVEQIARLAESRSLNGPGGVRGSTEGGFLVSAYAEADYAPGWRPPSTSMWRSRAGRCWRS